jgi:hypothetical protein
MLLLLTAGDKPVTENIILDRKITEQVSSLKYSGCEISYRNNRDVEEKLTRLCPYVVL